MIRNKFFPSGSIIDNIESMDKYSAIQEIILRSRVFHKIPNLDIQQFTEAVIQREKQQSTGFGHHCAIAHGRTETATYSTVALGISHHGIDFQSWDGKIVHFIFVVASHPHKEIDYLRILSTLAKLIRNNSFYHSILSCNGKKEVQRKIYRTFNQLMMSSNVS